jgi:hypothetical protein
MVTCLFDQNEMLECWIIGILGIKAEVKHQNCKNAFKPIIPLFQLGRSP